VLNEAQRHKNVWGSGGIAQFVLNLGIRWRYMVSFTPRSLYLLGK